MRLRSFLLLIFIYGCADATQDNSKVIGIDTLSIIKDSVLNNERANQNNDQKESASLALDMNGIYFNADHSILKVTKYDNGSFSFYIKLKGACEGIEEVSGLAVTDNDAKDHAVCYTEDGIELVQFNTNKDGSFQVEFAIDYIGMDCARAYDNHFIKSTK